MFAVKRYAGDARPCHRRRLRRRRTLKVSHRLGARGVRRFYLVTLQTKSAAAPASGTNSIRHARVLKGGSYSVSHFL
jgi:hypothetical protein